MAGPFFIGGTGRCGTSELRTVLGEHPKVHGLEWETRFVTDPGGFEDLARAPTVAYSPFHAADALERLAFLLNERPREHLGVLPRLGPGQGNPARAVPGRLRPAVAAADLV